MFEIVIESQSVKINGQALIPFAVLTGLHGKFKKRSLYLSKGFANTYVQYSSPDSPFSPSCRYILSWVWFGAFLFSLGTPSMRLRTGNGGWVS